MRFINELKEGDNVSEVYLCKTKQALKTKAGKNYYSLILQDKTGTIDTKIWELNSGIEHFEALDFIKVDGQVTTFQGTLQLNVRRVRKMQEGTYDPANYMPVSRFDIDTMYKELTGYIMRLTHPYLKALAESFFYQRRQIYQRF